MATEWIIVASEGYDVEDVDGPQSVTDVCPACERRVRLRERQLVKNLKVFSVALLAVEHGARVFECPHCGACFEPPDPEVLPERPGATAPAVDAKRLAELEDSLTRTEDEVSLWRLRVKLATRKGAADLAAEARGLVDRYEHVATGLRAELSRLRGTEATAPSDTVVRPPTVPQAVPSPAETSLPEALLKEALRGTSREPEIPSLPVPPVPADPSPEPTPAEVEDEMAALKRKLRKRD